MSSTAGPEIIKAYGQNKLHAKRHWLIEDIHKSWKSGGTQVEVLRMKTKDNLERVWQRWFKLQTILEGYYLSQSLNEEI